MKIIFLDVDGVLNSERSFRAGQLRLKTYTQDFANSDGDPYYKKITKCTIDPIACELINRICREHNVYIVVSSSHRKHFPDTDNKLYQLREYFTFLGLDGQRVIGWTTADVKGLPGKTGTESCLRGLEIQHWLDGVKDVTPDYVIVDDSQDMLPHQLKDHFVLTKNKDGLSIDNYHDILKLLKVKESVIIT
jgi:hypothetical protein